ncbi:MAG: formylmethionine deformylase [Sulfurimonas sp. RIFOXYD12_FULL_33_39]|uniref:peptide deformylase n=1 Tax=unclassified Sulfurimonas TaxID=2623549 RepID=UPI0008AFEECD|nr:MULTISPECIES: peptide deformylase [unclassified Sulfurimonas]OHE07119.1 MAG: formylmethionine deformylase [Sulfurimonas sp. RIFCSPLOWO2_12_FULL_34_6]OHE09106.1 MAG: formylmethionine deformylase [Sulfurimonas sp. RIFOXYD12_FULL_33_39]OHE14423.1 MAG: formylmethionine deformylase [Sulfurimonas sp. RIFOXYD2_FULL_34_21]
MIKEIITYPTPPSVEYATDVRVFNEDIFSLIEDMKDTIEANSIDGLAAFQIGSYYNVIVIKKDDGTFLELINPRIISTKGRVVTTERTAYFPNLSADVTRFETISLIYQDREANQHSLKADGNLSILIQRKIDYTFGSSFLNKLNKEEKKLFQKKLEFGSDIAISESCPTTFKRDYIIKIINVVMIAMVALVIASLLVENKMSQQLWNYQIYLFTTSVVLNIIYFFYAQYEGKQFSSCTSCQIGNIIGTTVISLVKLSAIMLLSYFIM